MRRNRKILAGSVLTLLLAGGAGLAAGADGVLTLSPTSGPPGTDYTVSVDCGQLPEVKQRHTQDGPSQGTIAPLPAEELDEIAPSTWQAAGVATNTDDEWFASCAGTPVGSARFDAESPHLWFGPRPSCCETPLEGRTTVNGTDCPPDSTVEVFIAIEDMVYPLSPVIDAYGDWSVELPVPVGQEEMSITASCGDVTYAPLHADGPGVVTSTLPTTSTTEPAELGQPGTATAPAATPVPGGANYTG